jgi:hypothetical protein
MRETRNMKRLRRFAMLMAVAFVSQLAAAQSDVAPAKELFRKYIALENKFDPLLADLYSDKAVIRNTRHYPNGVKRTIEIPAANYKELIRTAMPLAKARGDKNRYSFVKFNSEGGIVRIRAKRYSLAKNYSSPISLLLCYNRGPQD